jgi:hypothetical protein
MAKTTVNKWDGGIVDSYLSFPQNFSKELHNFLLDVDGKPYVRPGFFINDYRIPVATTSKRANGIYIGPEPFGYPLAFRGEKAYSMAANTDWTEIVGPESNVAVPNKTNTYLESLVLWKKQAIYGSGPSTVLPHRIYCSAFSTVGTFTALTLGLPALASSPTVTSSGGTGGNFSYAFHHYVQFTDYDGTVFEEKGPITYVDLSNAGAPNANVVHITAVPVLANTGSTNYIVSTTLKIKIYRTIDDGSTYYLLTTLNNGTTIYDDSTSDATIQANDTIYVDGDLLEYTQPPIGTKYICQVNDFFWYATDRVLTHSIQGEPGASPEEYQQHIDQPIKSLGNTISFPILFCDRSIYRVDGVFDELGDGGFDLREISQDAGCYAHRSIVRIPGGLVWAGNGGFYFTDGYQVKKISQGLNDRYKAWRNVSITGAYDPLRNIVFWTVSSSSNSNTNPNDMIVALHLNFGIQDYSVFTTLGSPNNLYPCALAYSDSIDVPSQFRSKLLMSDAVGYVHYMDPLCFTDPAIDQNILPTAFYKKAILYDYQSVGLKIGPEGERGYVQEITCDFNNQTDIATQFFSRRDDGGPWAEISEIRKDGNILWGISDVTWDDAGDDTDHSWNSTPVIEARRGFPAGTLRSTRRQVALRNSKTWIAHSDDYSTVTVSATAKTVTLNDAAFSWPDDCEEYEILFDDDTYTNYFRIKARTSTTVLTLYDPYGQLTSGATTKWQIRGYRKFERLYLLSYTIHSDDQGEMTQSVNRGVAEFINA